MMRNTIMHESPTEDAALRERLLTDPEVALAEQFTRYRTRLWRIVQFRLEPLVAARVDADDVLQDAWLAALQRLPHFLQKETLSMFVWLRLIVGQTIVDLHRHHLGAEMRDAYREVAVLDSGPTRSTSISMAARLLDQLASPSQAAIRQEVARQLEAAIEGMDPIDREVLAMRHFEELSNSEVAEALSVKGHKVRVGIKARDDVRILRRELCEPSRPAAARS